jgi:transcriptional regulator GlxA family with amidase domain
MKIAIPLFPQFAALDAIGPYEVLRLLPDAEVCFVAEQAGQVSTEDGAATMQVAHTLDSVMDPDIIVVPGGGGTRPLVAQVGPLVEWIAAVHPGTHYTTSVCTGSLLLGAAGVLDGLEATTHWAVLESLAKFGAKPVSRRVVVQGKVITAAGVSAGIDMALELAAAVAGEDVAKAIQLAIEYDPQPPFDSGSVEKADPATVRLVRQGIPDVPVTAS